jgi:hypothetical protein
VTQPGGPTFIVNQGAVVEIVLHNDLPGETTSLALHGQGLPADTVGVPFGTSKTYTFTASQPGTFLYEAGLTANGAKQVAMGLYGVLIVQPVTASTAYSNETVLLLSEIDPALNADPAGFNMLNYAPKYWLINGESHPDADVIQAPAGSTLLVRYVNAGLTEHSMGLLGLDQTVIAKDGHARPAFRAVAETMAAGQTMDTLITLPATVGARYPLYDTNRNLDNNGAANGGMMTFLEVVADLPPTVSITNPIDGATVSGAVTIEAAAADDVGVAQVEFFVDSLSVGVDANGANGWSVAWDTTLSANGAHVLTATATDTALQMTTSAPVNVTVSNVAPGNAAPAVDAGLDQTITLPTSSATMAATVTDDGLPTVPGTVTLLWTVVSEPTPGSASFVDATVEDATANFTEAGTYLLRLTADDGALAALDEVQITVAPAAPGNAAPAVDAGLDQTITLPTSSATMAATVTDDGLPTVPGTVTLLWTVVSEPTPGSASFVDATVEDATANFTEAGTYLLRLTADDGALAALDEVTITVNPEPIPLHVGDLDDDSSNQNDNYWRARAWVMAHNGSEVPVSGATVTATLTFGTSSVTVSCITGGNGRCRLLQSNIPDSVPSATFTITNVTKPGYSYNAAANHDPDTGNNASDGTTLTVLQEQ